MTKSGRTYTPQKTLEAEQALSDGWEGPMFDGPIRVDMQFHPEFTHVVIDEAGGEKSKLRGDLDNYVKLVLDGLQGVAFENDKQVVQIYAEKVG
jgi:Holliday junction resolvase RusA-like endonuclease